MAKEMTSEDVARKLGVTRSTVGKMVERGELRTAGVFARMKRFDADYIEQFALTYKRSPRGRKPAQREEVAA